MADTNTPFFSSGSSVALGHGVIRLVVADITTLPVEAFVFYARPDLALGAGFGSAIARRGGPTIQKALEAIGSVAPTEAVVTSGGTLKARFVVHAAGPTFQEPDLEPKLRATIEHALARAAEHGIRQLAFPAMGAGFYGIPLEQCAAVMVSTLAAYLSANGPVPDLVICANDRRESLAFERQLAALQSTAA